MDAASSSAALSSRSAVAGKHRAGGGGVSFPYHDTAAEKQYPWDHSSAAFKGDFNPEWRGETGVVSFTDHDTASSSSFRADEDDYYSSCARIYAPYLITTTPKNPGLTMEAWMASRSQSSRTNDTEVIRSFARPMRNVSAALAPQPHSGSRGWNPMGPDTDQARGVDEMGRPYRHVVSDPPPGEATASFAQGRGWHPMAAHRHQELAGMDVCPKTKLCVQLMTTGACRNGDSCRFAHVKEDLLCKYVQAGYMCPFPHQCYFRH